MSTHNIYFSAKVRKVYPILLASSCVPVIHNHSMSVLPSLFCSVCIKEDCRN